jgi:RimJ/RimL family protein N-acetyltransferase
VIESLETGQLLGGTGIAFSTPVSAVTGYVLAQDAWGKGYATEALAAIVALAHQLGVIRLSAHCHPANWASAHVLQKCGFVRLSESNAVAVFPNINLTEPLHVAEYVRIVRELSQG